MPRKSSSGNPYRTPGRVEPDARGARTTPAELEALLKICRKYDVRMYRDHELAFELAPLPLSPGDPGEGNPEPDATWDATDFYPEEPRHR